MKFLLLVSVALGFVIVVQPANAGLLTVYGTGLHDGVTMFDASATVDNLYDEYNPTVEFGYNVQVPWAELFTATVPNFGSIYFDFFELSGTNFLRMYFQPTSSGGFAVLDAFDVEFSSFEFSDGPDFSLQGVLTSDITTGLTPDLNVFSGVLSLSFDGFEVNESRSVLLEFEIGEDDGTGSSVVPVPAAAPMTLLGLGLLALARRFRRKTS